MGDSYEIAGIAVFVYKTRALPLSYVGVRSLLTLHSREQYCKQIRGRTCDFSRDKQEALRKCYAQADSLDVYNLDYPGDAPDGSLASSYLALASNPGAF
jgi:hypothetical protein